jgi:hypothetical protein
MAKRIFLQDIEYNIKNYFEDAILEVGSATIFPGKCERIWGGSAISIRAISNTNNKNVGCRISFETNDRLNFRLKLKREGKMWTLKQFNQENSPAPETMMTDNPKLDVRVEPDGQ